MTKKLSSYEMELDAAAKEHSKNCKALEYIYEDKSKMSWAEQEERPSSILGNIEIGFKAGAAYEKKRSAKLIKDIRSIQVSNADDFLHAVRNIVVAYEGGSNE